MYFYLDEGFTWVRVWDTKDFVMENIDRTKLQQIINSCNLNIYRYSEILEFFYKGFKASCWFDYNYKTNEGVALIMSLYFKNVPKSIIDKLKSSPKFRNDITYNIDGKNVTFTWATCAGNNSCMEEYMDEINIINYIYTNCSSSFNDCAICFTAGNCDYEAYLRSKKLLSGFKKDGAVSYSKILADFMNETLYPR